MKRSTLIRKAKKLKNNPKLFFSDMRSNNKNKYKSLMLKKKNKLVENGCNSYSVVSAVYNVDKYLDQFIKSIINQNLNFLCNIKLILVDDGSTDKSPEVINKWIEKYPDNIKYIRKENGGQASARNLGLKSVSTDWVAFIDPDDFINKHYFSVVDEFLEKNKSSNISLVACKMIVYREDLNEFRDTQPLSYCFKENEDIVPANNLGEKIQLSVSSALFKSNIIREHNLIFNNKIKPNFEDGKFVLDYLLLSEGNAAFLKNANYYYRVREDESSTTNTQWERPEKYRNVLEYGFIPMLLKYKESLGYVPKHAQKTALYFLMQYFQKFVNNSGGLNFLSVDQRAEFLKLMDESFSYIDRNEIMKFNMLGVWFFHKVGVDALFKEGYGFGFQMVYVKDIDYERKLLQISYYEQPGTIGSVFLDGNEAFPFEEKIVTHDFLGRSFRQHVVWVPFDSEAQELTVKFGVRTEFSIFGESYSNSIKVLDVGNIFSKKVPLHSIESNAFKDAWLFMDSNMRAGDNAEHLYRYVMNKTDTINAYFVLSKKSKDWGRLKKEGFKLLDIKSKAFDKAYKCSSVLISSHINRYFTEYDGKYSTLDKKFVFLQHGITKDDLSRWLNNTTKIDCLVTATKPEYESFVEQGSPYYLSKKETVLTGFPRYDRLCKLDIGGNKEILIMPTWRNHLAGEIVKGKTEREYNHLFNESEYFKYWQGFLLSEKLEVLANQFGYSVVFMPHPNLTQYLNEFSIPRFIKTADCNEVDMQSFIASCAVFITDYSSVAFDVAYLNKPSIYYQFDEDVVFNGSHTYSKGYFDYRKDGFGDVVLNQDELFLSLTVLLENKCNPSGIILNRMEKTFLRKDGENCKRVYEAILSMNFNHADACVNPKKIEEYAATAMASSEFNLAEQRWKELLKIADGNQKNTACAQLIISIAQQGRLTEASKLYKESISILCLENTNRVGGHLSIARHDWGQAVAYFKLINITNKQDGFGYAVSLAELGLSLNLKGLLNQSWAQDFTEVEAEYMACWLEICDGNWSVATKLALSLVEECKRIELKTLKSQLILARCLREMGRFAEANTELSNFEKHTKNDIACREEIARLAFANGNWDKVISQLRSAYPIKGDLPADLALIKIQSFENNIKAIAVEKVTDCSDQSRLVKTDGLLESGHLGRAQAIFDDMLANRQYRDLSREMKMMAAKLAMFRYEWQEALSHLEQCAPHDYISGIMRLKCLSALGRHKAIFRSLSSGAWHLDLSEQQRKLAHSLGHIAHQNWIPAIATLYDVIDSNDIKLQLYDKPHLLLADCLIKLGKLSEANDVLVKYEKLIHNDPKCRELIALLAFKRKNWKKVVTQLEKAYLDVRDVPLDLLIKMLIALSYLNRAEEVEDIMRALPDSISVKVGLAIKFKLSTKALPSTVDLVT